MRDRLTLALRFSSMTVVFAGYLALASVREYGAAILSIPALFLLTGPAGAWMDKTFPAYRTLLRAALIAYGCFIPLTVISLGLLHAVMTLVIVLQAALLAQRKTAKEYYYLFLMAFFLLLAACVQSPEPAIAVAMLLFLAGIVWALAAVRLIEERRHAPAVRFSHRPAALRQHESFDRGVMAWLSAASLLALGCTMAFFAFTPRMEAGFLGRAEPAVDRTGLSQTVEIRGGATIQNDPTAVMRVEFPDLPGGKYPGATPLYWRCSTLPWHYAAQWSRRGLRDHLEPHTPPLLLHPGIAVTRKFPLEDAHARWPEGQLIRQNIYVDEAPPEGLPCLDLVRDLRLAGNRRDAAVMWDDGNDFTVILVTAGPRRLTYEAISEVGDPTPEALRTASPDYASILSERELNLLTYHELSPEATAVVREVVAEKKRPYDQAKAIEQWLSGPAFEYSLEVPPLPAHNPIDAFITRVRRGHCELYASAMALMARSLGIPARVVSGFRGGEWNESDQSYIVRANMAHLWTELYFVNYGWVAFDPSPRAREEQAPIIHRFHQTISRHLLKAKMLWYQEVVGFDRAAAALRFRTFATGFVRAFQTDAAKPAPAAAGNPIRFAAFYIALGAGALLALWGIWRLSARTARARIPLTPDQLRARAVYRQLRKRLERIGVDVHGKTAEETLQETLRAAPGHAALAREIVEAYNRARFGLRAFPHNQAAQLRRRMRTLRRPHA